MLKGLTAVNESVRVKAAAGCFEASAWSQTRQVIVISPTHCAAGIMKLSVWSATAMLIATSGRGWIAPPGLIGFKDTVVLPVATTRLPVNWATAGLLVSRW